MLRFLEILAVFFGAGLLAWLVYQLTMGLPTRMASRQERKVRKIEVAASLRVTTNHQDLFLLVNDLLAIHGVGVNTVFPNRDLLHRAQEATDTYRNEITTP